MKWVLLAYSAFFIPACVGSGSLMDSFDRKGFELTGGTLFTTPAEVTMKEIHFENGNLLGKQVILQGEVIKVGQHHTHLIMKDETARMLVVLTNVLNADHLFGGKRPKVLRILGTVERGKKGLPFIQASSLNVFDQKEKA